LTEARRKLVLVGAVREMAVLADRLGWSIAIVVDPALTTRKAWAGCGEVHVRDDEAMARAIDIGVLDVAFATDQPALRKKLYHQWRDRGFRAPNLLGEEFGPGCGLADGIVVQASATMSCDLTLGVGARVNMRGVVMHDCVLEPFATVAPNATLLGHVHVGECAYIGAGSVVLPGRSIGSDAVVGAGAVVTRDVMSGQVVIGVRATELRR